MRRCQRAAWFELSRKTRLQWLQFRTFCDSRSTNITLAIVLRLLSRVVQRPGYLEGLFRELYYRRLRSAADPVVLPQLEPGAMRQPFIVPAIGGRDVGFLEGPDIRSVEH